MSTDIITFFNRISQEYDSLIARTVPRYREMFWAMFYYLPENFQPQNILELGCGTGNLTAIIRERWPNADITAVDISAEMLEQTREKLHSPDKLTLIASSFEDLSCSNNQFDLVISSIAMHHVNDTSKEKLINHIYGWLKPNGFFVLGDQVRGENQRLYEADIYFYETYALEQGASEPDIEKWREHRNTQDYYATLSNLTTWLRNSGFQDVDILWRYCFWAVLQAHKPVA